MAVPMKLLLLDPLNNEWGNGLVAINKMRGEMVDFPDNWEIGISDKTGTSAMQSFVIYKNEVYDIVKNYYDIDNNVRIFMCIKSREAYDNEEKWLSQKPNKKPDTSKPVTPTKSLFERAKEALAAGFTAANTTNSAALGKIVSDAIPYVYSTGTLSYALAIPNYREDINKINKWRSAVVEGEEAQAITYYDYNLTQSINLVSDAGVAYVVHDRIVDFICKDKTAAYINKITNEAKSYHKDATIEVGGQVVEVNGTVYVGWVAKISLPHMPKTKKDPLIDRAKVNLTQAFADAGVSNNEELASKVTQYLKKVTSDGKLNMNIVEPLEDKEMAKFNKWMEAVANEEHADGCSITIYTLTQDIDLDTNVGIAYNVTEDTVKSLPFTKTKEFISEQTETILDTCDDADFTFAGSVVETKGKVYVGWAVIIDLPTVEPPLSKQAAPLIAKAFAESNKAIDANLSSMVDAVLGTVDASGNINLNNATPLETDEQAKFDAWSEAVENGQHADACTMTIYTVTTDLDTDTNIGPAYKVTQDTLNSLAYKKTKEFIAEQGETVHSISPDATMAVGASVKEVNGKSYIGWAVTVSLPEVAATVTTPDTPVEAETHADTVATETVEDTPVETTEPEVTEEEASVVTEDAES